MLIDLFLLGIATIVAIDLLKLFVEQSFIKYTPKHERRRSA